MIKIFGLYTAMLTPFDFNGEIDFISLETMVKKQINAKVDGIVLFGSTGESSNILAEEKSEIITRVKTLLTKQEGSGKVQLIVGTGHNTTNETIKLTAQAKELGADAAMVVLPFYNRPSQEGIFQHFYAIHENVDIPIIIYNVPSRTSCSINNDTIARLSKYKNIIGLKDSSCNLANPIIVSSLIAQSKSQSSNINTEEFIQLSGEDCTALAFNAHGGQGCISVAGNIVPLQCKALQDLTLIHHDYSSALKIQQYLSPLYENLYCDTNPIPLKYAAYRMGLIREPIVRLPLWELSQVNKDKVEYALRLLNLI